MVQLKSMKLHFSLFIFLFFSPFHNLYAESYKAEYDVRLGNINIGGLVWILDVNNDNYKTNIDLSSGRFVSGLFKFEGSYESGGSFSSGGFIASYYKQVWKTNKKERRVDIFFKDGVISKLIISPEEKESPRINYIGVSQRLDPLSSFLNILSGKERSGTIDGRRTYFMVVKEKIKKEMFISKKVFIEEYTNIWADHKRNDLEYIEFDQSNDGGGVELLPFKIKIKFKGMVFNLVKN